MRYAASLVLAAAVGVSTCTAQNLPAVGAEWTLDVATWNIEHFGNDALDPDDATQLANAAAIIRQSEIDLWAIQEIEDGNAFRTLVETVGENWAGIVDERSSNLHVGFLYNENVIRLRSARNILTDVSNVFAGRPPLQIEVDVTLADTSLVMTFITLHMKAFGDAKSLAQRDAASRHLKNHIDYTTLSTRPVVVLGDFNDELTGSITPGQASPYENFLADSSNYFFSTYALDLAGANTFCFSARCSSGSTIDHILITDELFSASGRSSAEIYDDVFDAYTFYTSTTSDHLPVYTRFHFRQNTGVETVPDSRFEIHVVYPNPVRDVLTLGYSLAEAGRLSIRLVDTLGRVVLAPADRFAKSGRHSSIIDVAGLASGTYFLHVRTADSAIVKSIVVSR